MMKPSQWIMIGSVLLLMVLILTPGSYSREYDGAEQPKPFIIKGQALVVFAPGVDVSTHSNAFLQANFNLPTVDRILEKYQVTTARRGYSSPLTTIEDTEVADEFRRTYRLFFSEDESVEELLAELRQNPNIQVAEPVWAMPVRELIPDDGGFPLQWALKQVADHDIDATDAWDIETGSRNTILAMIDTGVNYRHRDLAPKIWINPGEDLDGDRVVMDPDDLNGVDDDGNGIVDDLIGYDFLTYGSNPEPGEDGSTRDPDPMDFDGHGTHCAGIAAGTTNNNMDISGISGGDADLHRSYGGSRIMCLRVGWLSTDGIGYVNTVDCADAITYACEMGADVINCSWGMSYTSGWNTAMNNVFTYGVNITHAAGNDGTSASQWIDSDPYTEVLSVAGTDLNDHKWEFSNYGPFVDVSAPGHLILSTVSDGLAGYPGPPVPDTATYSGTSMSAPQVCGQVLLIRSAMASLSKEQVDSLVINTADDINALNPGFEGQLGSGRINCYNSIVDLPKAFFEADVTGGNSPLEVNFSDLSPGPPSAWKWFFGTGDSSMVQNPTYTYNDLGLYDVSLYTDQGSGLGWGEKHLSEYLWVRADTIKVDSMEVMPSTTVEVPVYLANTQLIQDIQFSFKIIGDAILTSPHVTLGPRTSYFYNLQCNGYDPPAISYKLTSSASDESHYLEPGAGVMLNIHLTIDGDADGVIVIDTATASSKYPRLLSIFGEYWPEFAPCTLWVAGGCCIPPIRGDVNYDTAGPNIQDLTFLVAYLFGGGEEPPCMDEADVNGDTNGPNIQDLTHLVAYLFGGGAPPADCP